MKDILTFLISINAISQKQNLKELLKAEGTDIDLVRSA
jgi:hypothetical protein